MAEELHPGVYVEETGFRSRAIEGVPTATLGMAGETEYGPVSHPANHGVGRCGPVLVTSTSDYERVFGGVTHRGRPCRLSLAARGFFANGGQRLYVQRVLVPTPADADGGPDDDVAGVDLPVGAATAVARWRARWPGAAGSRVRVLTRFRRSGNLQVGTDLTGLMPGAAVETAPLVGGEPPALPDAQAPADLFLVTEVDGALRLLDAAGRLTTPDPDRAAFHITVDVEVQLGDRVDVHPDLELGPEHPRHVASVLRADGVPDEALVWLDVPEPLGAEGTPASRAAGLLAALLSPGDAGVQLVGGSDGADVTPGDLAGEPADAGASSPATGLAALGEVDEIALVALPDSTYFADEDVAAQAVDALVAHCERDGRRFAIIDPPEGASVATVRAFRSRFVSTVAALYHPWLRMPDPTAGSAQPQPTLEVPPSGAVAGVYARTDTVRGVHRAPADEVIHGITGLATRLTRAEQEVLNPEGINVLRHFEGRGDVVWGARTISADPEWRYVNVRRLVVFLERSIATSIQWAVFEPNGAPLWQAIRRAVEDFLTTVWRSGALTGRTPAEAFFVRCDPTTMTQNDLDNGRLVVLLGVAPTRPAEFVVVRIGQRTADAPDP
jgi:phage tail sheath protein FI